MATTQINDLAGYFRPVLLTDAVFSNPPRFTEQEATATKPTGSGVVNFSSTESPAIVVPQRIRVVLFGTLTAGLPATAQGFRLRVAGWSRALLAGSPDLWLPMPLAEIAANLGPKTGVLGTAVPDDRYFADRLEVADGYPTGPSGVEVYNPQPGAIAQAIIPVRGCSELRFLFNLDGGAASANALWAPL